MEVLEVEPICLSLKTEDLELPRLARQFLFVSKNQMGWTEVADPSKLHSAASTVDEMDQKVYVGSIDYPGRIIKDMQTFLCKH